MKITITTELFDHYNGLRYPRQTVKVSQENPDFDDCLKMLIEACENLDIQVPQNLKKDYM